MRSRRGRVSSETSRWRYLRESDISDSKVLLRRDKGEGKRGVVTTDNTSTTRDDLIHFESETGERLSGIRDTKGNCGGIEVGGEMEDGAMRSGDDPVEGRVREGLKRKED